MVDEFIDSIVDEEEGKEDDGNDKPSQSLIWFTGIIERDSGKAISDAIGRRRKIAQIGGSLLASPLSSLSPSLSKKKVVD
jgi:hypothetical protein